MSVYLRKRKEGAEPTFYYDFKVGGRRFYGPTGQTSKREALKYVNTVIRPSIAAGTYGQRVEVVTLDLAAGRWWRDIGQHNRSADALAHRIQVVLRLLGPNTPIVNIRAAEVNGAIQKRRAEPKQNIAAKRGGKASTKTVSNATVNRDIIDTLRPILRHAEEVYEVALPKIPWRKLRLKEPPEKVAEFSLDEIQRWGAELGPMERTFLTIALTYGPRFGELFFPPDALRLDGDIPRMELGRYKGRSWRDSRKDGSVHAVPLLEEHARALAALASRAKAAGLDVIWFDETKAGKLIEITYWGMASRLRKAANRAGISKERLLHAMRHHAGTRILRATGNIILAQRTLGHRQVGTTQRYAHATDADVRAGLKAASHAGPDAPALQHAKTLARQGEQGD